MSDIIKRLDSIIFEATEKQLVSDMQKLINKGNSLAQVWSNIRRMYRNIDKKRFEKIYKSLINESVSESFDTDVKIETVKNTRNDMTLGFDINGVPYEFFAEGDYNWSDTCDWSIEFGIKNKHSYDKKFGITGAGNQMKVFSAIAKCFDMFLKEKKPRIFWFEATKETSRRKLYDRFAKMILQKYPYKMFDPSMLHDDDIEQYSYKIYAFERK
jgi:hypothetical protein